MSAAPAAVPVDPVPLRQGDRGPVETSEAFTRTDFVRYAGASGDFHPIHHDETFAVGAGMPSVFGMGLLHGGMLGAYVARWVGPANIRTFSLRFLERVWPGDAIQMSGQVESVTVVDGQPLATVVVEATSSRSETVARARAEVTIAG